MGDKWLTSGRARIKALQKRGPFAANATARAVLNERPGKTRTVRAEQTSRIPKYRSGNVRGNYSAYADPIFRRAVVGQKTENVDDAEDYAIHPGRRRRIRDQKALYAHYNPNYGKKHRPREVVYQQRSPQTFQQDDAGRYSDQMEPRRPSDQPRAFVPVRQLPERPTYHDPMLHCGPTPHHNWYGADQQSQASGLSPKSLHLYQQQVVPHLGPMHPPPNQYHHLFQNATSLVDQGSREFGAREQRQHMSSTYEEYPHAADTAVADPRDFDGQGVYQQQGFSTPVWREIGQERIDQHEFDQQAFDLQGFDQQAFDPQAFDEQQFDPQVFDEQQFDPQVFDLQGFTSPAPRHFGDHEFDQQGLAASASRHFGDQGTYQQGFTTTAPQAYDAANRIDLCRRADASSHVNPFPHFDESAFNEDFPDPFFPDEAAGSLPNDCAVDSVFGETVDYGVEPEFPEDNPIPQVVSILPNTGIDRFKRNAATETPAASSKLSDQSYLFAVDGHKTQVRGLMPPPMNRNYQPTKASRSHFQERNEHHDDRENDIVRQFHTWKEDPAIRFFNEKVEVDAENRPLLRPGSPVFNDDLNLLGKKSFWE